MNVVDEFVRETNPENEVEMRFKDPSVHNGVDFETYERVLRYFSTALGWKKHPDGEVTSLVVFYKHRTKNFQFRTVDGRTEFKKKIFHGHMKEKLDKPNRSTECDAPSPRRKSCTFATFINSRRPSVAFARARRSSRGTCAWTARR